MLLATHSLHFRVHTRVLVTLLVLLAVTSVALAEPRHRVLLREAAAAQPSGNLAEVTPHREGSPHGGGSGIAETGRIKTKVLVHCIVCRAVVATAELRRAVSSAHRPVVARSRRGPDTCAASCRSILVAGR